MRQKKSGAKRVVVKVPAKDAVDAGKIARNAADCLIARHGSKLAFVIARKIHEKAYANYKVQLKRHGKPN